MTFYHDMHLRFITEHNASTLSITKLDITHNESTMLTCSLPWWYRDIASRCMTSTCVLSSLTDSIKSFVAATYFYKQRENIQKINQIKRKSHLSYTYTKRTVIGIIVYSQRQRKSEKAQIKGMYTRDKVNRLMSLCLWQRSQGGTVTEYYLSDSLWQTDTIVISSTNKSSFVYNCHSNR